ncbi:uncharacterized protein B4U79_01429 [Dinothrombium tinctorium]|uniref:Uncharacterized protein n=1 Tax=Dinothrombium tinctorium TaxID=1965070 RepID=A0A443QBY2_9ACAR|nr:uncharacterized protein B4U79_01429 [Dinothrombium tinctorium]
MLPESFESPESLVTLSKECEFLCKSSKTCLRRDLVCNGFPNCPNTGNGANYEDELESICHKNSFLLSLLTNKIFWSLAALSMLTLLIFILLYTFLRFKHFRKKNNQF